MWMGKSLPLCYCVMILGRLPHHQNTITIAAGHCQRHWLIGKNQTGWLYRSQSVDWLLYNQGAHTWILIWSVSAELSKIWSKYSQLLGWNCTLGNLWLLLLFSSWKELVTVTIHNLKFIQIIRIIHCFSELYFKKTKVFGNKKGVWKWLCGVATFVCGMHT